MGKQNLYEHVKPPLLFAGPGVPKGRSGALAYLFDLPPTLCDYAGLPTPKAWEGRSLLPVMKGEKQAVRDTLFAAYRDVQRMVRDERWKLIWYPKVGRFQLFDLMHDPDEMHDLSNQPEYADRLATMKKLLAKQQSHWADPAPRPE
jgi:arylsulfatase A-like enzyme